MFVFKLQSVLDYRKNIEEKIINVFSEKNRELEKEKLELKNLSSERVNLLGELRKIQNMLLTVDNITLYVSYVEQVCEKEKRQKRVIARVNDELEALRSELLEAAKKLKVMEKLKERHSEEYENESRVFEKTNSDEMAILKFGRREK
jgi:flagellar protein FliJ